MQPHNPAAPTKAVGASTWPAAATPEKQEMATMDSYAGTGPTTVSTATSPVTFPTSPLSGVDQLFDLLSKGHNDDLDWQRSVMVSPSVDVIASTPAKAAGAGASVAAAASSTKKMRKGSALAGTSRNTADTDTTVPLDQICSFFAKMTYSEDGSASGAAASLSTRTPTIPGVNDGDEDVVDVPGGLVCHNTRWVTGHATAPAPAVDGSSNNSSTIPNSSAPAPAPAHASAGTSPAGPHQDVIVKEVDQHLRFYSDYFYNQDHTNFVGKSDALGAVVISLRRETGDHSNHRRYRAIVRSTKTGVARLTINESKVAEQCQGSVSIADVLHTVAPAVVQHENCLYHAKVGSLPH